MRAALALCLLCCACLPAQAARFVALAPHLTELMFEAGAGGQLLAVSSWSDYPPQARKLPQVSDAFHADYEAILQLKPDWVLVWKEGTPVQIQHKLQSLGLPVWAISIRKLADIPATLRAMGRRAGTVEAAERAAIRFEQRLRRLGPVQTPQPVPVFIQISHKPLMTVNGEHLLSEVVEFCGGRNIFAELPTLVPRVGLESLLQRKPVWVLQSTTQPEQPWFDRVEQGLLPAIQVLSLPPEQWLRPTSRMLQGVERICRALQTNQEAWFLLGLFELEQGGSSTAVIDFSFIFRSSRTKGELSYFVESTQASGRRCGSGRAGAFCPDGKMRAVEAGSRIGTTPACTTESSGNKPGKPRFFAALFSEKRALRAGADAFRRNQSNGPQQGA